MIYWRYQKITMSGFMYILVTKEILKLSAQVSNNTNHFENSTKYHRVPGPIVTTLYPWASAKLEITLNFSTFYICVVKEEEIPGFRIYQLLNVKPLVGHEWRFETWYPAEFQCTAINIMPIRYDHGMQFEVITRDFGDFRITNKQHLGKDKSVCCSQVVRPESQKFVLDFL